MTEYVCSVLVPSDTGQTCAVWVEQQPILPNLTDTQRNEICVSIALFLSVCYIWKKLRSVA